MIVLFTKKKYMVKLFIEDKEIDLNKDINIPITLSFEDLNNPTKITNTFSKTVTIPSTKKNDQVFGEIWRFDRTQLYGTGNTGVYFNPNYRASFKLFDNNSLIASGYIRLNEIQNTRGIIQYNINLFGEKGNFFKELQEKELVDLDFYNDLEHRINKDYIIADFLNPQNPDFRYVMTNSGIYNEFENGSEIGYNEDGVLDYIDLGQDWDSQTRREIRSYYSTPTLSMKSVINKICAESSYDVELSPQFFTNTNPLYTDTYLMLPPLNKDKKEHFFNNSVQTTNWTNPQEGFLIDIFEKGTTNTALRFINPDAFFQSNGVIALSTLSTPYNFKIDNCGIYIQFEFDEPSPDNDQYFLGLTDMDTSLTITFNFGTTQLHRVIINNTIGVNIRATAGSRIGTLYLGLTQLQMFFSSELLGQTNFFDTPISVSFNYTNPNPTQLNRVTVYGDNGGVRIGKFRAFVLGMQNGVNTYVTVTNDELVRSGSLLDKNNLIPKNITQFKILTDYTKLFGLIYDFEKDTNKLRILTKNEYFENHSILDWSNKMDRSKTITINPLTFTDRFYQLSYKESENQRALDYKTQTNREYGSFLIDTSFQFNNNTKKVLDDNIYTNVVISQEFDYRFDGYSTQKNRDILKLPCCFTLSNNQRDNLDESMGLVFIDGLQNTLIGSKFLVSDDSPFEIDNEKFAWQTQTVNPNDFIDYIPNTARYMVKNDVPYSLDFGKPSLSFDNSDWNEAASIYNMFHKKWYEDRYSVDSRILTAYFNLGIEDINTLQFNNFIMIDNVLWMLNKIIDWDITKEQLTKCELIKINDIENYTNAVTLPTPIKYDINVLNANPIKIYYIELFNLRTNEIIYTTPIQTNEVNINFIGNFMANVLDGDIIELRLFEDNIFVKSNTVVYQKFRTITSTITMVRIIEYSIDVYYAPEIPLTLRFIDILNNIVLHTQPFTPNSFPYNVWGNFESNMYLGWEHNIRVEVVDNSTVIGSTNIMLTPLNYLQGDIEIEQPQPTAITYTINYSNVPTNTNLTYYFDNGDAVLLYTLPFTTTAATGTITGSFNPSEIVNNGEYIGLRLNNGATQLADDSTYMANNSVSFTIAIAPPTRQIMVPYSILFGGVPYLPEYIAIEIRHNGVIVHQQPVTIPSGAENWEEQGYFMWNTTLPSPINTSFVILANSYSQGFNNEEMWQENETLRSNFYFNNL